MTVATLDWTSRSGPAQPWTTLAVGDDVARIQNEPTTDPTGLLAPNPDYGIHRAFGTRRDGIVELLRGYGHSVLSIRRRLGGNNDP